MDFRQGIEPVEEGFCVMVVLQAAVELLANVAGQAGDFPDAFGAGVRLIEGATPHPGRLLVVVG